MVFLDESGFLMAPWLRRSWSPRGQTPLLMQRARSHEKVSVIAAICVNPPRDRVHLLFRLHPHVNITAHRVAGFLGRLHRHLGAPIVLVWDRLLAHRARRVGAFLRERPGMHTFFLPPYAPELNPVEYLWSHLKTNPLANLAPPEADALAAAARRHSRSLQHKPRLLRSFLEHSPLLLRLK